MLTHKFRYETEKNPSTQFEDEEGDTPKRESNSARKLKSPLIDKLMEANKPDLHRRMKAQEELKKQLGNGHQVFAQKNKLKLNESSENEEGSYDDLPASTKQRYDAMGDDSYQYDSFGDPNFNKLLVNSPKDKVKPIPKDNHADVIKIGKCKTKIFPVSICV